MMVTSSVFEEGRLEWGAEKKVDWGGESSQQFAGYSCRGPCLELLPVFLSGGWAVLTDDHRGAFSAQWFGSALKFNMQVRNDKHPTVPESGLRREEWSFLKCQFSSCWNEEGRKHEESWEGFWEETRYIFTMFCSYDHSVLLCVCEERGRERSWESCVILRKLLNSLIHFDVDETS